MSPMYHKIICPIISLIDLQYRFNIICTNLPRFEHYISPEEIEGPPEPKFWGWGIMLVTIGLAFQLFGIVFSVLNPSF